MRQQANVEKQDEPWQPLVPGRLGTRNIAAVHHDSHAGTSYCRCDASHLTDAVEAEARAQRRVIAQKIPPSKGNHNERRTNIENTHYFGYTLQEYPRKYTAATIGLCRSGMFGARRARCQTAIDLVILAARER
jgi:hypothetical protein